MGSSQLRFSKLSVLDEISPPLEDFCNYNESKKGQSALLRGMSSESTFYSLLVANTPAWVCTISKFQGGGCGQKEELHKFLP